MKLGSLYIYQDSQYTWEKLKELKLKDCDHAIVVGVANVGSHFDLDYFLKRFPQFKVVHRLPDMINNNYWVPPEQYKDSSHMLQTAILTWDK
jgi:hypothetical protein